MRRLILFVIILLTTIVSSQNYTLPNYVHEDLTKLKFTYELLDTFADSIYVGWNNYRSYPVKITYENGFSILIGYPEKEEHFVVCDGIDVDGKQIYADTSKTNNLQIDQHRHLSGGLGINTADGATIWGLNLRSFKATENMSFDTDNLSETLELLTLVHELTHALQSDFRMQYRSGMFNYDADINYAVYSNMEGLALRNAYREKQISRKKEHLEEFLFLREMKRASIDSNLAVCEMNYESLEGFAEYSSIRLAELIMKYPGKVKPLIKKYGFCKSLYEDIAKTREEILGRFTKHLAETFHPRKKVYGYGLLQVIICEQLGGASSMWVKNKDTRYVEDVCHSLIDTNSLRQIELNVLKEQYSYDNIVDYHAPQIAFRDSVINAVNNQAGTKYNINFRRTRKYLSQLLGDSKSRIHYGRDYYYSGKINDFSYDKISLKIKTNLAKVRRIWNLEFVDISDKVFTLDYSRIEKDNIYYDAVLKTESFELQAPKIRIVKKEDGYYITILSRV